jgi:hypothetical protein
LVTFWLAVAKIDKAQGPNLPGEHKSKDESTANHNYSIAKTKFLKIGDNKVCPHEIHHDKTQDEDRSSHQKANLQ